MPFLGKAGPPNHWKEMPTSAPFSMGINLTSCNYYSPEWLFVDLFKTCMPWLSQTAASGGDWDTGFADQMPVDENGYPLQVPFNVGGVDQKPITLMARSHTHYPTGEYTVLFDGDGELEFQYSGVVINEDDHANGRYVIQIDAWSSGLYLAITSSTLGNNVRNIRVVMPGFADTYEEQIFHPLFLKNIKNYGALRLMNLQSTNEGVTGTWAERTTTTNYTQATGNGIAYEHQIELCNRLQIPGWFNVSHLAGKDYFDNLGSLVAEKYDPNLDIYVEYGNELWNDSFDSTDYAREQGCADSLCFVPHTAGTDWGIAGCDDALSSARWQALQSIRLFESFGTAFGDNNTTRLKRVVASHFANDWTSGIVLNAFADPTINPNGTHPDALAVAPYYGGSVANEIYAAGESATITVDQILDRAQTHLREFIPSKLSALMALVDGYEVNGSPHPIELHGYEGGQHLVGTGNAMNDTVLTEKLIEANDHPRMRDMNIELFNTWFEGGGGLFCYFSSVYQPSKFGSWGARKYQDVDTIKNDTLIEYIGADVVDTIRPTTPLNYVVVDVTETTITTSWDESLDDTAVTGYKASLNGSEDGVTLSPSYTYSNLTPGETYNLSVQGYDANFNYSLPSITLAATTNSSQDTEKPTAPTNLAVQDVTDTTIQLGWGLSTDNIGVVRYEVFADGEKVGESAISPFVITNLSPSTDYSLTVQAFDAAGNPSDLSEVLIANTNQAPDTVKPTAPVNLVAIEITENSISFGWGASTDNVAVTGYKVYDNLVEIGTPTTNTFTHNALTAATDHIYTVRAYDAEDNYSDLSEAATFRTSPLPDTEGPTTPANLVEVERTETSITFTWDASTDNTGVAEYKIFADGIEVGTVESNLFTRNDLSPSESHNYTVQSFDAAGNYSDRSVHITLATLEAAIIGPTSNDRRLTVEETNRHPALLNIVEQGATFGYSTGLNSSFTTTMSVKQYPNSEATITRSVTFNEVILAGEETQELAVGQWFIHTNSTDGYQTITGKRKIYISKGWM